MVPDSVLQEVYRHAEEGYPYEVCGVVIGRPGELSTYEVRRCRNIINEKHAEDPVRYPRDARTAYMIDGLDLLKIQREAEKKEMELVVFYHSHPDHDAYFSQTDRRDVMFGDTPAWPEARYLVVSVRESQVVNAKFFQWDPAQRDFVDSGVAISTGGQ